jgi:hypothetical protein
MTPESHTSINADDINNDVAIHHEIKCRAYELYERQHDTLDGHDLKDKLQAELPVWPMQRPSFRSTPTARPGIPDPSERPGFTCVL